jgi:hypothetical protein
MSAIQVAKAVPKPRFGFPRRFLVIALLALSVLAFALVATIAAWPSGDESRVGVGSVDDFQADTVMHFENDGFFIVRLEDGSFLALHDRATGHLNDPIEWMEDLDYGGLTGWFRAPAHHETYDREGVLVFGPAVRGMDRYRLEIRGDELYVYTDQLYCGEGDAGGSEPCDGLDVPSPLAP